MADLFGRGIHSLLVEGGSAVHASFAAAGLYDRVAVNCAPLLVGGSAAPGPVGGPGLGLLATVPRLENLSARGRGPDVILTAERQGCLPDLLLNAGA